MTKKFRSKKSKTVISLLLIGAILIGGAFAFLTAQDSKTNVFTIGKIDISLIEKFDTNTNGTIDDGETYDATTKTPPTIENIIPGQTVLKEPYVINDSSTPCHLYMTVSIPTLATDEAFVQNEGDSLTISGDQKIEVKAYAIQDGYSDKTSVADIWNSYFEKNITSFGEEGDLNRTQMFNLNDFGSDWGQLGNIKAVKNTDENGNVSYSNVYIFAYKGTATTVDETTTYDYLLPGNETSQSLFKSVTMNRRIGDTTALQIDGMETEFVSLATTYNYDDSVEPIDGSDFYPIIPLAHETYNYYIYGLRYDFDTKKDPTTPSEQEILTNRINAVLEAKGITEPKTKVKKASKIGGTGTVITVTGSDENNTVEYTCNFTVIYFGDANGDGSIGSLDSTLLANAINGTLEFTASQKKAMDLNPDNKIDANDLTVLTSVLTKQASIDQNKGRIVCAAGHEVYINEAGELCCKDTKTEKRVSCDYSSRIPEDELIDN